jgi:iron complex outermembrane receptor protein
MRYLIILFFLLWFGFSSYGQFTLSGKIINEKNQPLTGSHIHTKYLNTASNPIGEFEINGLPKGELRVYISYLGYTTCDTLVDMTEDVVLNVKLKAKIDVMSEVVVEEESTNKRLKKEVALNTEVVNNTFIQKNLGGSLMQTLERVGGISTISIGSGQSKPMIRGLGFNRVVVTENGVKHEGQQWGADHGLEIDQFAVDEVKIVKGPASLQYGSDAIGGVIEIEKSRTPEKNTFGGSAILTGKTNNNLYGSSVNLFKRNESFFIDSRLTYLDYADYKVPTDFISIYSYRAPLYKNKLRNTAGNEFNAHLTTGISKDNFSSVFYMSNLRTKSGLFANAHGLEPRNVDTDLHDASDRDIQNPYQFVNHFKIINRTRITQEKYKLEFELGFQNNFREEFSDYISHGFMPPVYPDFMTIPNTLERGFNKNTYSLNAKAFFSIKNHHFSVGFNGEHHNNNIDGWGFIIPEYKQSNGGLFVYDKFDLSEKMVLHAGLRYDLGTIETENYFDWFTTPIEGTETNLQRAFAMQRNFGNLSWSLGANYNLENVLLRAHFGKSFRMPIAKELASNGVNYHQFSYELGNPNLSAEESYQFDFGITWQKKRFNLDINPFVNYFPNYIYLNPTPDFDFAYGAGNQIFEYTESEVLRYGGEVKLNYAFTENYHTEVIGEYVYAEQQSGLKKGFTLPFSPPPSVLLNFTYKKDFNESFKNGFAGIDFKYVGTQNEIVPPEEKTPGYELINLAFGGDWVLNKQLFQINFQVQNLLNSKNLNHTSFYRLIGVPEPGRNFILTVKIPFLIQNGS